MLCTVCAALPVSTLQPSALARGNARRVVCKARRYAPCPAHSALSARRYEESPTPARIAPATCTSSRRRGTRGCIAKRQQRSTDRIHPALRLSARRYGACGFIVKLPLRPLPASSPQYFALARGGAEKVPSPASYPPATSRLRGLLQSAVCNPARIQPAAYNHSARRRERNRFTKRRMRRPARIHHAIFNISAAARGASRFVARRYARFFLLRAGASSLNLRSIYIRAVLRPSFFRKNGKNCGIPS